MKKKILFLVNHDVTIYTTRKELVQRLLDEGYEVVISSPYGERIELLEDMGCEYIETEVNRHGTNPLEDLELLDYYKQILNVVKPDMIFSYTIKPNLYGAMAAKSMNIPIVINITGLGSAIENGGVMEKAIRQMYKVAFDDVNCIFVQNTANEQYFLDHNLATDKLRLIPGSGVNLEHFHLLDYPNDDIIRFVFISRIMKEKGIDQYLETARYIKEKYPNTEFHICGFCEEEYEDILKDYEDKGIIINHGLVMDTREILKDCHCTILPSSYPEGLNNVLLESCATGRAIITTGRPGCGEIVDDGINGYLVEEHDTQSVIDAVENFMKLTNEEKKDMGLAGRKKAEENFDRKIIIDAYMDELKKQETKDALKLASNHMAHRRHVPLLFR